MQRDISSHLRKRFYRFYFGICYDGCATNTGKNGGVIRHLELSLDRPLQWMVCMLHLNELPFRHIFEALDGPTTGPKTFEGEIGKELKRDLRLLPIANFKQIEGCMIEIPSDVLDQLSTDQTYLYHMGMAVQRGKSYLDHCGYANKAPGEIHHARWLTRANRVLRLYLSKSNPSPSLVKSFHFWYLVTYLDGSTSSNILIVAMEQRTYSN